jgi:hypothetical protein
MTKRERALRLAKQTKRVVWFGTTGWAGWTKNGRQKWDRGRDTYKAYPNSEVIGPIDKNVFFPKPPKNALFIPGCYEGTL